MSQQVTLILIVIVWGGYLLSIMALLENYKELKNILQNQGHNFLSETDTEVIPHLIENFLNNGKILILRFLIFKNDKRGVCSPTQ